MQEFGGKTYEEAIKKAVDYFKLPESELIIEKISDNPKSVLDILREKQTGQVYIRVRPKELGEHEKHEIEYFESYKSEVKSEPDKETLVPDYVQKSLEVIRKIAELLEAEVQITFENRSGEYIIRIDGKDKGMLIGKHGNTLNSIQNYINFIINRNLSKDQRRYVIVDSDNYRERRRKHLIDLALKTAKIVQQKKEPVTLPPMLAFERKIIHLALKDNQYVTTYSVGENPYKSVVIAPLLDSSENTFA
ncbi:MAG: RNA-binding cell elongation regulator Jag/EloR [bacterium]